jgi:glycosyltransferase involved in cell wall biosynthesis
MKKRKKIGFLISELEAGGAQRVIVSLADKFVDSGIDAEIVVFDNSNQFFSSKANIINLNIVPNKRLFNRLTNIWLRFLKLSRVKITRNYSVVISFLESPNFFNAITRFNRTKTIISIRNHNQSGVLGRGILLQFTLLLSDAIVFPSNDMRLHFSKYDKKTYTIHNPVIKKKVGLLDAEIGHVKVPNRFILSVGRLEIQKGQWLIIRAFKEINKVRKDIKLVILGEGSLRNEYNSLIEELDLTDYIIMPGNVDNIDYYYKTCECVVQTSLYEGFPNVLLEALNNEAIVVSTNCPNGPREIISPKASNISKVDYFTPSMGNFGILIEFNDYSVSRLRNEDYSIEIDLIKNTVLKLLNSSELRNFYIAQSRLRSMQFNINNIFSEWVRLINNFS